MGRLLVLVVLVVLAVWLVRRAIGRSGIGKKGPSKTLAEGELVRCAHCGVHLPRNEARQASGNLYCSDEHARLGKS